jgi:hypothetical protein
MTIIKIHASQEKTVNYYKNLRTIVMSNTRSHNAHSRHSVID